MKKYVVINFSQDGKELWFHGNDLEEAKQFCERWNKAGFSCHVFQRYLYYKPVCNLEVLTEDDLI